MKKTLGQAGLDFIANKYKELKELVSKKADKSDIKTKLSELNGDSTHRTVSDTEKSNWNNKVDKVSGKSLSTNDYDNTAKSKVDAIPTNPKYTDTTYDLSKYAQKSDISRCKTDGYSSASSWSSVSSSRDLEDWIGDFDKRTRELKDAGGGELKTWVFGQNLQCVATKIGKLVVIYFNGQDFYNWGRRPTLPSEFRPSWHYFRNASSLSSGDKEIAFNCGSGTYVSMLDSGEIRLMAYGRNASRGDAFVANIVYFTD